MEKNKYIKIDLYIKSCYTIQTIMPFSFDNLQRFLSFLDCSDNNKMYNNKIILLIYMFQHNYICSIIPDHLFINILICILYKYYTILHPYWNYTIDLFIDIDDICLNGYLYSKIKCPCPFRHMYRMLYRCKLYYQESNTGKRPRRWEFTSFTDVNYILKFIYKQLDKYNKKHGQVYIQFIIYETLNLQELDEIIKLFKHTYCHCCIRHNRNMIGM